MSFVMRGLALGGLTLALVGSTFRALDAAYVIKLNNGNEYVTTRYWQEGRQVLFDAYGGVFGIEKSFILKIEKSDKILRRPAMDSEPLKQSRPVSDDTDTAETKAGSDSKAYTKREVDDPIVIEFNRLKEKSKAVGGMLTHEIRDLLNQITAYKNKLTRNSKLFVEYGREFNELHEIGARVENALRSRTQ